MKFFPELGMRVEVKGLGPRRIIFIDRNKFVVRVCTEREFADMTWAQARFFSPDIPWSDIDGS